MVLQTVKSCGKAHGWCGVCRPEQAARQRKPDGNFARRQRPERACNYCGKCDVCKGLTAPEGMKVCRKCGETKPIKVFPKRNDTGGVRNHCYACRRKSDVETYRCALCNRQSTRVVGASDLCSRCRPQQPNKICKTCNNAFASSMSNRDYCSSPCQQIGVQLARRAQSKARRLEVLAFYSDGNIQCACCGEATAAFLALDHINGGGRQQMDTMGGGNYWAWLYRERPDGFQVLCHNCNMGRQLNGGICPHKN